MSDQVSTVPVDTFKPVFPYPESTEESWYLCRSVGEGRGKVAVRV